MSPERRRLLESFGSGPAMLAAALRRFPRRMWVYRPSANCPSIHETIWQLADSEVVEYVECRRLIAKLDSLAFGVDPSGWCSSLGYFYQDIKEAMGIIRLFRRVTYHLLKTLPEISWTNRVALPVHGDLSLDEWLEIRESCFPEHIERMERIYSQWIEAARPARTVTSTHKSPSAESFAKEHSSVG
jgi:hypothetical protein